MTQSGWLAAALVLGFLLFLAANGKLQAYWSLLVGGSAGGSAGSAGGSATTPAAPLSPAASLKQWFGSFFPNDPVIKSIFEHLF
jgi:hypothetical protein